MTADSLWPIGVYTGTAMRNGENDDTLPEQGVVVSRRVTAAQN
jgi:hypothetical protein